MSPSTPGKKAARRGYQTIKVPIDAQKGTEIVVRTSARIADALKQITADMTLFKGVKLQQVLKSFYEQGKKDGAREVIERQQAALDATKKEIPHRPPGRPKKN